MKQLISTIKAMWVLLPVVLGAAILFVAFALTITAPAENDGSNCKIICAENGVAYLAYDSGKALALALYVDINGKPIGSTKNAKL